MYLVTMGGRILFKSRNNGYYQEYIIDESMKSHIPTVIDIFRNDVVKRHTSARLRYYYVNVMIEYCYMCLHLAYSVHYVVILIYM